MSAIAGRLVVASGLLVILVGSAFAVLLLSVADLRKSEGLVLHSQEVLASANRLERLIIDLETGQRGFVITGEERFLAPWHSARTALPGQSRSLERLVADNPAQLDRAQAISRDAESYLTTYSIPLLEDARRDPASVRTDAVTAEGTRRMDAIRVQFDRLLTAEQRLSSERGERSDVVADRAYAAVAGGLVGSVLLIIGFAAYLTRSIVRPVLQTTAMAKRLSDGDLSIRVQETGVGEIRTLERAFNVMAASLEQMRAELAASRIRIVTSADETRRRIERDLHDGIQQRLVSMALDLRLTQANLPADEPEPGNQLDRVVRGLEDTLEELREISRGIHPAILAEGGLGPALRTLARRSPIPVEMDVNVEKRLPRSVEVAAYYAVSEALANAAKYSNASTVRVEVKVDGPELFVSVTDDGGGGADPAHGTGLTGLTDRVQAVGGAMTIISPPGTGTALKVTLPVSAE